MGNLGYASDSVRITDIILQKLIIQDIVTDKDQGKSIYSTFNLAPRTP